MLVLTVMFFGGCIPKRNAVPDRNICKIMNYLSQDGAEGELFKYLCQSRYWSVKPQGHQVRCDLTDNAKSYIFKTQEWKNKHVSIYYDNMLNICSVDLHRKLLENDLLCTYISEVVDDLIEGTAERRLKTEHSIRNGFTNFGICDINVEHSSSQVLEENKISGWINLGRKGAIRAVLSDTIKGLPLGVSKRHRSVVYVGFSDDPMQKFYFEIPLFLDGDGELAEVNITLQSVPDDAVVFTTNTFLQTWVK